MIAADDAEPPGTNTAAEGRNDEPILAEEEADTDAGAGVLLAG